MLKKSWSFDNRFWGNIVFLNSLISYFSDRFYAAVDLSKIKLPRYSISIFSDQVKEARSPHKRLKRNDFCRIKECG